MNRGGERWNVPLPKKGPGTNEKKYEPKTPAPKNDKKDKGK